MKKSIPTIIVFALIACAGMTIFKKIESAVITKRHQAEEKAAIQRLAQTHHASYEYRKRYRDFFGTRTVEAIATTLQKQRAIGSIKSHITCNPILFMGRVSDIRETTGSYKIEATDFLLLPFTLNATCSKSMAEELDAKITESLRICTEVVFVVRVATIENIFPSKDDDMLQFGLCGEVIAFRILQYSPDEQWIESVNFSAQSEDDSSLGTRTEE